MVNLEYIYDKVLHDDPTSETGGIPFQGYTLKEYLEETQLEPESLEHLNKCLKQSGILPIRKDINS